MKRRRGSLPDDIVRAIYLSRDSHAVLAARHGRSKAQINSIRAGKNYATITGDLPRYRDRRPHISPEVRTAIRKATGRVEDIARRLNVSVATVSRYRPLQRHEKQMAQRTPKAVRLAVAASVGSPAIIGKRFGISRNTVWEIRKSFVWSEILSPRTNLGLPWPTMIAAMKDAMIAKVDGPKPISTKRVRPGYLRSDSGLVIVTREYSVSNRPIKNIQVGPGN